MGIGQNNDIFTYLFILYYSFENCSYNWQDTF